MESIVKYLRVKLGANIATLKSKFADLERKYSGNEYYEEFMGIINKAEYSIEDINDLLLCYSDHDLSLEEILSLVSKDEPIYYDKDNFGTSFQINTFLLYFLLSSKNTEVIKGTLKLFSTENLRINRNFEFANYCTLREFNTFYDIYYNLDTILNCKNEELQKKRAICFMYYIDELSCLEELKHIGITIEDVESFIKEYEATGKLLDGFSLGRLFQNVSFVIDKEFGSDKLYLKVKDEYNKYVSSHDNFKLEDFIAYYNENFADDFSVFNYKDGEKVLLDEDEKIKINNKLQEILKNIKDKPKIKITYFINDKRKSGGKYITIIDNVKKIDMIEKYIMLESKTKIYFKDIFDIQNL